MTVSKEMIPLDPIAFFAALVLSPFVVTLMTFYLLVPMRALILGLPVYLALGTPVLLWMVGRYPPVFATYAGAGLVVNLALVIFCRWLAEFRDGMELMTVLATIGFLFAPLWAGCFAWLYRSFYRVRFASGAVNNPILKLKEMMK
ncbi:hypothetical protein [Neogemmobacter tilapiae]|uniref:Uncharacterized protein n=1 Tax=Neogemmobacter tilapiae TaxID=875041 RepID=A0A918TNA5_9RHOB|nr:hypothetical protein [Gemmobacter tilapiae]GHC55881.1 hypothetical protein GCM10007315_18860 [Gemmobacter tilapiae]